MLAQQRRGRCLGHVINRVAQAQLLATGEDKVLDSLEVNIRYGEEQEIAKFWRKFGCLGRLHNIIRYIRHSPQRREEFRSIEIGGELAEFDKLQVCNRDGISHNYLD